MNIKAKIAIWFWLLWGLVYNSPTKFRTRLVACFSIVIGARFWFAFFFVLSGAMLSVLTGNFKDFKEFWGFFIFLVLFPSVVGYLLIASGFSLLKGKKDGWIVLLIISGFEAVGAVGEVHMQHDLSQVKNLIIALVVFICLLTDPPHKWATVGRDNKSNDGTCSQNENEA